MPPQKPTASNALLLCLSDRKVSVAWRRDKKAEVAGDGTDQKSIILGIVGKDKKAAFHYSTSNMKSLEVSRRGSYDHILFFKIVVLSEIS